MRVLVFGDSIAEGKYDSHGGWVARFAGHENKAAVERIHSENKKLVCNVSVSGDTTESVIERFSRELEARYNPDNELLVILAIGSNDSALVDNRVLTDEQDFVHSYSKLIDMANDYTPSVLLVGLPSVDEPLAESMKDLFRGKVYSNNRLNLFEDCIKQVAIERQVPFVKIHDNFLKLQLAHGDMLSPDGLHPNDKGHQFIYDQVRQALDQLL